MFPAKVIEVGTNTCVIKPKFYYEFEYRNQKHTREPPIIRDVPVMYPRGGNSIIMMPIKVDDIVLVACSQHSLKKLLINLENIKVEQTKEFGLEGAVILGGFIIENEFGQLFESKAKYEIPSDVTMIYDDTIVMQSTKDDGKMWIQSKVDIGVPGKAKGLDIGEGGSYKEDVEGNVIVKAFTYDASAGSGSRFAEIQLDSSNTWLGDQGDRLYVGCENKFWAMRLSIAVAKTSEILLGKYWNGSDLAAFTYMGIKKDSVAQIANAILEQTSEKEYVVINGGIDSNWAAIDDQTDKIPDAGENLYWVCLEVPTGGLTTPPQTDEIRVRGSDVDIVTGTPYVVYWGVSRPRLHDRVSVVEFKSPAGTPTATLVITSTQSQIVFNFRSGLNDDAGGFWELPEGIDTSCPLLIQLHYAADAAINTADIQTDVKKLIGDAVIGVGETSDYTTTVNINVAVANILYQDYELLSVDISDMSPEDIVSFKIKRTDSNGNSFYPVLATLNYVRWALGEHL